MRHVTITDSHAQTTIDVPTVESWDVVVQEVLTRLRPTTILTLSGELGAGKTTFVQHLGEALGIKRPPQSPTFALMRIYPVPHHAFVSRIVHVDAYRFESPNEANVLDLDEERAEQGTVVVIEWPEKMQPWIDAHAHDIVHLHISL